MNEITIYLRDWCPYCHRARALFKAKGVDTTEIDIEKEPDREREMIERAGGRRTVPQIFVGDEHLGGYDDVAALDRLGKLDELIGTGVSGE